MTQDPPQQVSGKQALVAEIREWGNTAMAAASLLIPLGVVGWIVTAVNSLRSFVAPSVQWIVQTAGFLAFIGTVTAIAYVYRSYRSKVLEANTLRDTLRQAEDDLRAARDANRKLVQREQELCEEHDKAFVAQGLQYSVQIESLKTEIEELQTELKCLCHGNKVADETILAQEYLEELLSKPAGITDKELTEALWYVARTIQEVTASADSLIQCGFYVPNDDDGSLRHVGWINPSIKGKAKSDLTKRSKALVEKYRESKDRGFVKSTLGDPANEDYHIGIQALRSGENLFVVFAAVGRSERALQACEKILELFARMAGKLSTAKATAPRLATPGLTPVRKEAPRD